MTELTPDIVSTSAAAPAGMVEAAVPPAKAEVTPPTASATPGESKSPPARGSVPRAVAGKGRRRELPDYTRSLLRIKVPLVVTLAENRQPLRRIMELGPGSIIQFEKSCEDMLELSVGNHPVAMGEAVKVGDKFGLRVTSIIMPGERFRPIRPADKTAGKP